MPEVRASLAGRDEVTQYAIPSMSELDKTKKTHTAVSTFSGAGGSSLGYKWAGFRVLWASEFVESAAEVYRLNHPGTILDERDIREVTGEEILAAIGLSVGELDLFDGSPPCASFSTSGRLNEGWGEVKQYSEKRQRVDDLFYEYARILEELKPKTFVAENVKGLVTGKSIGIFRDVLATLKKCGYKVRAAVVDALWLGVPQSRKRLIFVGVRDDLAAEPAFPAPLKKYYRLKDAAPDVVAYLAGGSPDRWKSAQHPYGTVTQRAGNMSRTAYLSANGYVRDKSGEVRKLTIEELRAICGFPHDFKLTGSFAQKWERLGRAVPPPMARAIAQTIKEKCLS